MIQQSSVPGLAAALAPPHTATGVNAHNVKGFGNKQANRGRQRLSRLAGFNQSSDLASVHSRNIKNLQARKHSQRSDPIAARPRPACLSLEHNFTGQ